MLLYEEDCRISGMFYSERLFKQNFGATFFSVTQQDVYVRFRKKSEELFLFKMGVA